MRWALAHGEDRRDERDQHEQEDEPQSRRHCLFFGGSDAELIPHTTLRHG